MNRLPTCALALGLFGAGLTAQAWTSDLLLTDSTETTVVQVSGLVVTGDSLSPLPYCTVYRARDRRGTMTDVRGFFSLPALEGDTLEFSSVGYVTHRAIIPEGSEMGRVNLVQPMGRDTVNMDPIDMYDRLIEVGRDGQSTATDVLSAQAIQAGYSGQAPPVNLLNPVAWAKFLKALRDGDLKRQ